MKRNDPLIDRSPEQKRLHLAAITAAMDGSIAKIAYLTSPAPDRYIINVQLFGSDDVFRIEIGEGHLANIIVDGASFALRKSHRVQPTQTGDAEHEYERFPDGA